MPKLRPARGLIDDGVVAIDRDRSGVRSGPETEHDRTVGGPCARHRGAEKVEDLRRRRVVGFEPCRRPAELDVEGRGDRPRPRQVDDAVARQRAQARFHLRRDRAGRLGVRLLQQRDDLGDRPLAVAELPDREGARVQGEAGHPLRMIDEGLVVERGEESVVASPRPQEGAGQRCSRLSTSFMRRLSCFHSALGPPCAT